MYLGAPSWYGVDMDSTKLWIGLSTVFALLCGYNAVTLALSGAWFGTVFQAALAALNGYFAWRGIRQLRAR